jgi:hypothetical protein
LLHLSFKKENKMWSGFCFTSLLKKRTKCGVDFASPLF